MSKGEKTGGSVNYYTVDVPQHLTTDDRPGYTAQCLEVIEALGMSFSEGEAFKAIWRSCAARTLGKVKADNDARYNAEKVVFYGGRMLKAVAPCAQFQEGKMRSQNSNLDKKGSDRPLPPPAPVPFLCMEHLCKNKAVEGEKMCADHLH
jgi:hypothetical protein